jgi:hypothetical protein
MNKKHTQAALWLAIILSVGLTGCAGALAPQSTATLNPTEIEQSLNIMRTAAAETVAAQLTEQAILFPSPTTTLTPTVTLTHTMEPLPASSTPITLPGTTEAPPTATLAPGALVPTATPRPAAANPTITECKVVSVSPVYNTKFRPSTDFDARWTLKNTSTETWKEDSLEVRYIAGDKFQQYSDSLMLQMDVKAGESVEFIVDMIAPAEQGSYSTAWGLFRGSKNLCVIYTNLTVE